jgi:hypothetical protein
MPTLSVNTKRGQSLDASKLHTCVTRDCEVLRITCDIRAIDMRVFATSTNITSLTCPDCQVKRQSCGGRQAMSHLKIRNNNNQQSRAACTSNTLAAARDDSAPNLPSSAARLGHTAHLVHLLLSDGSPAHRCPKVKCQGSKVKSQRSKVKGQRSKVK